MSLQQEFPLVVLAAAFQQVENFYVAAYTYMYIYGQKTEKEEGRFMSLQKRE